MKAVFYRGSGFGAWLVRAWTRSPYGHCAALHDGTTVVEAVWTGVQARPWGGHPQDAGATTVDVPGTESERAWAFLSAQVGKGYDLPGVLLDVAGRLMPLYGLHYEVTTRWDCSRLVAWACALQGWRGPAWRVPATPGGLYDALTAGPSCVKSAPPPIITPAIR